MPELTFVYGVMGCGKTTELMRMHENYTRRGFRPFVIKPSVDTKAKGLISRLGVELEADIVIDPDEDILFQIPWYVDVILVDEAQFLTKAQVDALYAATHKMSLPVFCFGLRTDFQTHGFPGSLRLFEVADTLREIPTVCSCGHKATFNIRYRDGVPVVEGDQVAIDGDGVTYDTMCGYCRYNQGLV
jgi:Thymidine kinase